MRTRSDIDFDLLRIFLGIEESTATRLTRDLQFASPGYGRIATKLVIEGAIERQRLRSSPRVGTLTFTRREVTPPHEQNGLVHE